jgi:hypothetical protein
METLRGVMNLGPQRFPESAYRIVHNGTDDTVLHRMSALYAINVAGSAGETRWHAAWPHKQQFMIDADGANSFQYLRTTASRAGTADQSGGVDAVELL